MKSVPIAVGLMLFAFSVECESADILNLLAQYISPETSSNHQNVEWEAIQDTPNVESRYRPQGLDFYDDSTLIYSESWDDLSNRIFVMAIQQDGLTEKASFDMPVEAVHTSGLSIVGNTLWAVDFISNYLYAINLESSIQQRVALSELTVPTGLDRSGSLARFKYKGKQVVAVTEFWESATTYIANIDELTEETTLISKAHCKFSNAGFNQGIKFHNGHLFESHNVLGVDIIYVIDVEKACATGNYKDGLVMSFNAPDVMVEDLAIRDGIIYSSDEHTFKFYRAELPPIPR